MANLTAGNGIFLVLVGTVIFMLFGFFGSHPYYAMQSTVAETVEGGVSPRMYDLRKGLSAG